MRLPAHGFLRYSSLVCCFVTGAVQAQVPSRTLDEIASEQAAAEARQVQREAERTDIQIFVDKLKSDMTALGRDTDALEIRATELTGRVVGLGKEAGMLEARVARDREGVARLVATLQRIENNPPPAVAAGDTALAAARAARLTSHLAAKLKSRTDRLALDLGELEDVRTRLSRESEELDAQRDALAERRAELRGLAAEKTAALARLQSESARESRRLAALAAEADSLRELLGRLEGEAAAMPRIKPARPISPDGVTPRLKPDVGLPAPRASLLASLPEGLRFADARGQLSLPVRGTIRTGYGGGENGLTLSAGAGAQVVSPYSGRVEFAGDFKNYQRLVILNAGDGYFIVLTGLGETFVSAGESVSAGEPLGQMPRASAPELYVEFRKNGRPFDPGPWLAEGVG